MEEQRSNTNLSQFCNDINKCGVKNFKKKIRFSDRKHDWKLKWRHLMIVFTEAKLRIVQWTVFDLTIHSAITNVSSWVLRVCVCPLYLMILQQERSSQKVEHYYQGKKNWKKERTKWLNKTEWNRKKQVTERRLLLYTHDSSVSVFNSLPFWYPISFPKVWFGTSNIRK